LRSLGAFVFYNLIFGFALPGIDNAAHIGGLVTGLIVGALIAVIAPRHEDGTRRALVFGVVLAALAGGAMMLAHHYHVPLRLQRIHFAQPEN
jgi:rhomboid protease GluP